MMTQTQNLSFQSLYDEYHRSHLPPAPTAQLTTMELFCKRRRCASSGSTTMSAFDRIDMCRKGLEALDRQGWDRSYHQRQFHEQFIRACVRIFYKSEPAGTFQRDQQRLLQRNGWNNLSQEILISTPRRFGKTISVSLFAAAMLYSAPRVELSIYSTCKRISQKLLRNIKRFLDLIYVELGIQPYRVVRRYSYSYSYSYYFSLYLLLAFSNTNTTTTNTSLSLSLYSNCEELVIQGPESKQDLRQVNSYPSKVAFQCIIIIITIILLLLFNSYYHYYCYLHHSPKRSISAGMTCRQCRDERACSPRPSSLQHASFPSGHCVLVAC